MRGERLETREGCCYTAGAVMRLERHGDGKWCAESHDCRAMWSLMWPDGAWFVNLRRPRATIVRWPGPRVDQRDPYLWVSFFELCLPGPS